MEDKSGAAQDLVMQFLCSQTKACNRIPLTQFPFSLQARDAFASFWAFSTLKKNCIQDNPIQYMQFCTFFVEKIRQITMVDYNFAGKC